jgi:MHS family proline/betaine transporter-like MFS transporter
MTSDARGAFEAAASFGHGASRKASRRVLVGGAVGQFVEFYDFALYGLLALTVATVYFPGDNPTLGLISTFATYGVAFAARPLGGVFFGALGDCVGRRTVLFVTIMLMGISTAAMGSIPSYETIGVAGPLLLLLCRIGQGFSAGGESVGAATFVYEHAPANSRGFWMGVCLGVTALPTIVGGGLILALSQVLSVEAFETWGWRIPFWLALPLSLVGLWIRLKTEESEEFIQARAKHPDVARSPIRSAFRNDKLRMLQVVFVMGLAALNFYFLSGYLVSYVQVSGDLSRNASLIANGIAMGIFALLLPTFGRLSDKVGRRPLLVVGGLATAVGVIPNFALMTSGHLALAILGQTLYVVLACIYGGGAYVFFVELFHTSNRFTTAAISYNVGSAAFGGTAPLIGTALVETTGNSIAPGYYVSAIAAIVVVLILLTKVPETRNAVKRSPRKERTA